MDGHFVPNITIGPLIVEAIRPITSLPLDVHLMIENPDNYIPTFAQAGADIITVHVEACPHLHRTIQLIKSHGIKAGVVLNPHTPVSAIEHVLEDIDMVLLMTVNPGFGGQKFIHSVLPKIKQVADMVKERNLEVEIEVDGGVNAETKKALCGSRSKCTCSWVRVYNQKDRGEAIRVIRG